MGIFIRSTRVLYFPDFLESQTCMNTVRTRHFSLPVELPGACTTHLENKGEEAG